MNTKTILACDDEPFILETISYIVNKEAFNLITADNGIEAIDLARKHMPELILLDVNMPGLTGFEVCKALKSDETTRNILIAMLTANVQADHITQANDVGADYFIPKPFSPRELKNKLHEILD